MSAPSDGNLLASRLREARTTIGLTQADVAIALRIHRPAVSAIECGNRNVTGLELCHLARLYRRPVAWLLGATDPGVSDEITAATAHLSERNRAVVLAFARFLAHQEETQ